MDVGAIGGGMMAGGAAGLSGASLVGQIAPGSAAAPTTVQAALAGSNTSVQQLADLLSGFTTAEILFALMLMAAMDKKDGPSASSGFEFLAGLAMAGRAAQSTATMCSAAIPQASPGDGVGGNLSVSA